MSSYHADDADNSISTPDAPQRARLHFELNRSEKMNDTVKT